MSNIKEIFKSKLWFFSLAYLLFIVIDPLHFKQELPKSLLYLFLYFLIVLIVLVWILIKGFVESFKKTRSWKDLFCFEAHKHWISILLQLFSIYYLSLYLPTAKEIFDKDITKIKLEMQKNPKKYLDCAKNAKRAPYGSIISICDYKKEQVFDAPLVIAVIYDPNDYIINDKENRGHLIFLTASACIKGVNGIDNASKLLNHYYYVVFRPEFDSDYKYYFPMNNN